MYTNQHRKTFIILKYEKRRIIPEEFQADDNRFPESLVEFILDRYTKKGDTIIDIFAGLGTTLFVAEKMGRIPFGIEYDRKRCDFIQSNLKSRKSIVFGDVLKLDELSLPEFDFCFSSPPYMGKDETTNPFTCYETRGTYEQYLDDIQLIYSKVKKKMRLNSRVVIEVSNLKVKGKEEPTMLAWDIAKSVSKVLNFEGEIVIGWESKDPAKNEGSYGYGYDHSYCLVFSG